MTPDVNVLLAAFRASHPQHAIAREWLDRSLGDCARGETGLSLLPMVISGFLRLATNERVFADPDPPEAAVEFMDAIVGSPGVLLRADGSWPILRRRILSGRLRGNAVTDAWIAAATEAVGEHLVTFDKHFKGLLEKSDLTLLPVGGAT